jgi:hypothetical protein
MHIRINEISMIIKNKTNESVESFLLFCLLIEFVLTHYRKVKEDEHEEKDLVTELNNIEDYFSNVEKK